MEEHLAMRAYITSLPKPLLSRDDSVGMLSSCLSSTRKSSNASVLSRKAAAQETSAAQFRPINPASFSRLRDRSAMGKDSNHGSTHG